MMVYIVMMKDDEDSSLQVVRVYDTAKKAQEYVEGSWNLWPRGTYIWQEWDVN